MDSRSVGIVDWIRYFYGEPGMVFSSLLRGMLIPSEGHELFVADFSKIEVAVLWWLADNEAGLRVLRGGLDPYRYQAAFNTGREYIDIPKDGPDRQLGKAQILGCLGAGSLVATVDGYKPIEEITTEDQIWDGIGWVAHGGLLHQGEKAVMTSGIGSIKSTPDHWFLRDHVWRTAVEIASGADTKRQPSVPPTEARLLYRMSTIEGAPAVSMCAAYAELKKQFASISSGEAKIFFASSALNLLMGSAAAAEETAISWLIQNLESVGRLVSEISGIDVATLVRKTSRGMEVAESNADSNPSVIFWNTLLRCAGLINGGSAWIELITMDTMSPETYESFLTQLTTEIKPTFDLISPRTRCFAVRGGLAHNCGFGMGAINFRDTAWSLYRVKLSLKQSKEAVLNYRTANDAVPDLWRTYEQAALEVVRRGGEKRAGKCRFIYDPSRYYGGLRFLWIELPSGRRLAYADPRISWRVRQYDVIETDAKGEEVIVTKTSEPKETLEFWAVNSKTKKWALERTWGGTLAENVTQAVARDLMMLAIVRLEKRGYKGLLTVHDEAITEKAIGHGDVDEFNSIMCEIPPWAVGMPIAADGWKGPRYRKG